MPDAPTTEPRDGLDQAPSSTEGSTDAPIAADELRAMVDGPDGDRDGGPLARVRAAGQQAWDASREWSERFLAAVAAWRKERIRKRGGRSNRSTWWLLLGLVVLGVGMGVSLWYLAPSVEGEEITLDEFAGLLGERRVVFARFLDEDALIVGGYVEEGVGEPVEDPVLRPPQGAAPEGEGIFQVAYPASDSATGPLLQAVIDAGAEVEVEPQPIKGIVRLIATVLLPLMILANLFALLFVGARDGGGGTLGELTQFGSVGAGAQKKGAKKPVTFADVAGVNEAIVELREVVDYLVNPDRYAGLGASPPKGVLLFGPPGCGKTMLAKAVAGEAGVPFFSVAGAEFVEQLVGVGAARVRDLFARVRAAAPAIVFIDELDAAGRKRGTGDASGGSDEREQTLNQLLVEMDGFEVAEGIVIMGATNRPDILDPALLRPGRFDRHVEIEQPDAEGREAILHVHARRKPIDADVDFAEVARKTPGFTGADLANVVNEAALLSIRQGKATISPSELTEAIERVRGGPQKRGRLLSDTERRRIAVHEAGHAMALAGTGRAKDIDRVTILARANSSLGGTRLAGAEEDAVLLTERQLRNQLIQSMGGTAAEMLVFGDLSTGTERDLERATDLARDLVARYGMNVEIGPVRLLAHDADTYLGGTAKLGPMAPETQRLLDQEIRNLLDEARDLARALLETNRGLLDTFADLLIEREHLEGAALHDLLGRIEVPAELGDASVLR